MEQLRCWARICLTRFATISDLIPRGLLPIMDAAVIIIGFLLILGGAPPMILLSLVALVFLSPLVEVTVRAVRRQNETERAELHLRPALEAYRPEFIVYFASTVGANYQVGMWLPYFVRIGRPFIIVTRTAPMLAQIGRLCEEYGVTAPLIYRRTLRSIEEIIVDSMATAFYVNNAARNTHLVERRELTHVWLNHGDSEKPACFNPVHAIYDLIFAAGQAGIDRYARHGVSIPPEKFMIVGRPQVELITPGTRTYRHDRTAHGALRTDLARAVRGQPGLLAAGRPADCRAAAGPWCQGDLSRTSVQLSISRRKGDDRGHRRRSGCRSGGQWPGASVGSGSGTPDERRRLLQRL